MSAIASPLILDVVKLPVSVQLCECWRESDGKMLPCDEMATHVFVYDGNLDSDGTEPRNCLSCPEHTPEL